MLTSTDKVHKVLLYFSIVIDSGIDSTVIIKYMEACVEVEELGAAG